MSGVYPGFKKGGGAGGLRARPQDFCSQFRGLFKEFGAKKGRPLRPPLWICACRSYLKIGKKTSMGIQVSPAFPANFYTTHRPYVNQCWADGVDGGPTLDQHCMSRCVVFAGLLS